MSNLNKYIKIKNRRHHVSSINLDPDHRKFLKEHNLNLSLLIRDFLDALMKEKEREDNGKK